MCHNALGIFDRESNEKVTGIGTFKGRFSKSGMACLSQPMCSDCAFYILVLETDPIPKWQKVESNTPLIHQKISK